MRFCHKPGVPARALWHDVPSQGKEAMAQTLGFMLYVLGLGLESQVLALGLGLVAYVLGLAICVLDSITDSQLVRYLTHLYSFTTREC